MSVARSSLIMASGTVVSRVLGFIRAVLLAAMIGVTTNAADAFGVANQLPNNVWAIIAGGVLNAILVPQLVKARSHIDGGAGYINRLLTMAIVAFGGIALVATLAAPLLVSIYTSGWKPSHLALATAFAYWCLPQLFFYGLYSMLGEVLNARSAFGPYMWAPVLNNVVSLLGMGAYIAIFGMDPTGKNSVEHWGAGQITLLAVSATAGVAAQAIILLFAWRRIGLHFKPNFQWRGFGLGPALKAGAWTLAMVLATQIAGIFQSSVASSAVEGRAGGDVASVAASGIAWLIFMLPHSVGTVSLATVYFTRIATHAHEGKMTEVKQDLRDGMRIVGLISVLATAALIVLAYPISRVFVGEYAGTMALAKVLVAFMVGLLPFSLGFFMQKAFYSLEDTKTPFYITLLQSALYIAGALVIQVQVAPIHRVQTLAFLTSGTVLISTMLYYFLLRRRIGSFGTGLVGSIFRFAIAALVGGLLGKLVLSLAGGTSLGHFAVRSILDAVLTCGGIGVVILLGFVGTLWAIRAPEFKLLLTTVGPLLGRVRGMLKR
ncbi:MAG: murein biosynthesis integral membrane protein MurJ [Actinomycetales bacterium]|nr:murein biosynthesis integral membrane protein MurJ [Actinomycetales bacterium]